MAYSSSWSTTLFVLLTLLVVAKWDLPVALAAVTVSPSLCKEERRLITNTCRPVIFGSTPSSACCERVRAMHLECICPVVTPKLAALLNIPRVIKQIEGCGRPVPHRFKCGSITTP